MNRYTIELITKQGILDRVVTAETMFPREGYYHFYNSLPLGERKSVAFYPIDRTVITKIQEVT